MGLTAMGLTLKRALPGIQAAEVHPLPGLRESPCPPWLSPDWPFSGVPSKGRGGAAKHLGREAFLPDSFFV